MSGIKPSISHVSAAVEYLVQNNFHDAANALQNEFINPTEYSTSISASQCAHECNCFMEFFESLLDDVKAELFNCIFPIFVHVYILFMVENDVEGARLFYIKHVGVLLDNLFYREIVEDLLDVDPGNFLENKNVKIFRRVKYNISLSPNTLQIFKRFLSLNQTLKSLIQHFFAIHSAPTLPNQFFGQFANQSGQKLLFGLLSDAVSDDDRRKSVVRTKHIRNDLPSPNVGRVPLPAKMVAELNQRKPSKKRLLISADSPPSIYIYSLLNYKNSVTSACISDDSTLMSATFTDNRLGIFGLTSNSLLRIKSMQELEQIDLENVTDITGLLCDERNTASNLRVLNGHSGPVYQSSFNPIGDQIVSCSQDSTIRLWSLMTYSSLCVFKDIGGAIWDVKFSPYGHYFLSGGRDSVAKMWSCDSPQPLRMFVGHVADVTCLAHHPNGNYVGTGSHDGMVRVWDVYDGRCVLLFTGHRGTVNTLIFSNDGRFLVSGGVDGCLMLWGLVTGELAVKLTCGNEQVTTLAFSRDGDVLTCGTRGSKIIIWDFRSILRHLSRIESDSSFLVFDWNDCEYLLSKYLTKDTALYFLHFTNRNLLLGVDVLHNDSDE